MSAGKLTEAEQQIQRVTSLDQRRAERDESLPAAGEPAITFGMDDDRIMFRDQAALDEYVAGAMLEHSRYHGGGVDECSGDPSSPCAAIARIVGPFRSDTEIEHVARGGDGA